MKLSKVGEFGLIKALQKKCPAHSPEILTGIGDDAAVVAAKNKKQLITADMLIEGVHFALSFTTFEQLGYKFLAVNVSDILAMGGEPAHFLISLGIPEDCNAEDIHELYSGISKAARQFGTYVIGGDTCASKKGLVLSGTLFGYADRVIPRSGAKEGNGIFVNNTLGDSAMGLHLLKKSRRKVHRFSPATSRLRLIKKHLMPRPAPLRSTSGITSMIDISDGLLADLSHICDKSKTGAVIYKDKIPLSRELQSAADKLGEDPLQYALTGGEDYVLLYTAPANHRTGDYKIGEILKKGRYITDAEGNKTPFKAEGYEHFKSSGQKKKLKADR